MQRAILILAAVLLAGCKPSGPPSSLGPQGYHVRGDEVWYVTTWTNAPYQITSADAATFKTPLPNDPGGSYATDKAQVYYRGELVPQAEPDSFAVLDENFSRDARHIFRGTFLICDDPDHFKSFYPHYVANSHAVYRLGNSRGSPEERVLTTDVANFRDLAPGALGAFYADSTKLYVANAVLTDINLASFKFLGVGHWKDDRQVYYREKPMPEGTDMATFEALEEGYARDSKRAYYLGKVLPDSDGGTFVVTDPRWPKAKDSRHRYDQGTVLPPE